MNIFYLDPDPYVAAQMHCDQHVHKMLLETAQMMSTAHHQGSLWSIKDIYKPSHTNHPSTVWVRHSEETYTWTFQLFDALSAEYRHRYGKVHATERKLLDQLWAFPELASEGWCEPPQCMPDEFKSDDTVQAYRRFYIHDKSSFARWVKNRPMPDWYAAATTIGNRP